MKILRSISSILLALVPAMLIFCGQSFSTPRPTTETSRVRGIVLDQNDAPVAGASVGLSGVRSNPIKSNADGRFQFSDVPGGNFILTVEKQGYHKFEIPFVLKAGVCETISIHMVKPRSSSSVILAPVPAVFMLSEQSFFAPPPTSDTITYTGIVVDQNGTPVVDASVHLSGMMSNHKMQSSTDGSFSFSGIPSGYFTLIVKKKGYDKFVLPMVKPLPFGVNSGLCSKITILMVKKESIKFY